jgi:hypothetical protein
MHRIYYIGSLSLRLAVLGLAVMNTAQASESSKMPESTVLATVVDTNGQPARLLSAFFGLDNGLSLRAMFTHPTA